jgi:hypothetical protein
MRTITIGGALLAILFSGLTVVSAAPIPPSDEPTTRQLADAKAAYARHRARYRRETDPETKQTTHIFALVHPTTTDANLKALPDLPFPFGLFIYSNRVTDAGVKELKAALPKCWIDH